MDRVAQAIENLIEQTGLTGLNPVEMIIQLIATVVLILVVKYFFWNKITAFIETRRSIVEGELTEAMEKNEAAKQFKKDAMNTLDEAKKEAQTLVEDAKNRGEDTRREIIRQAKDDAEKIKKNAKKDMNKEIEMARNKLQNEAVEIAMFLTEKAINKDIKKATYESLLDEAIKAVGKQ